MDKIQTRAHHNRISVSLRSVLRVCVFCSFFVLFCFVFFFVFFFFFFFLGGGVMVMDGIGNR